MHVSMVDPKHYSNDNQIVITSLTMIMSLGNLRKIKLLEILSVNLNATQFAVLVVGLMLEFLLLHIFIDKKKISFFYSLVLGPLGSGSIENRESKPAAQGKETDTDDAEVVLRSLGIFSKGCGNHGVPARLDEDWILSVFEEKGVGSEEVKEAFDVFDENGDGFIDAKELQKVLCGLGWKEGLEIESCMGMIGVFDEDGDGRIDFGEFVKLMEDSRVD